MKPPSNGPAPLVEVYRTQQRECTHFGSIAVVDVDGRVLLAVGDAQGPVYLRSSAKPFQASTLLEMGVGDRYSWTDAELALICASHGAQSFHLQTVQSILAKAELSESALRCGPHPPMHPAAQHELIRLGRPPTAIHNNCSGKHAGMLAACRHLGLPTTDYFAAEHPLQQANARTVAAYAGCPVDSLASGVDGCGVPCFYLPLYQAARAFARLATPGYRPDGHESAADRIVAAMHACPDHVAHEGDFAAVLLKHLGDRVAAKGGAEGVFCAGIRNLGVGIAVKISDGSSRPIPAVVIRLLEPYVAHAPLDLLRKTFLGPLRNTRGEAVGDVRVVDW